jgi:hypothetical protein
MLCLRPARYRRRREALRKSHGLAYRSSPEPDYMNPPMTLTSARLGAFERSAPIGVQAIALKYVSLAEGQTTAGVIWFAREASARERSMRVEAGVMVFDFTFASSRRVKPPHPPTPRRPSRRAFFKSRFQTEKWNCKSAGKQPRIRDSSSPRAPSRANGAMNSRALLPGHSATNLSAKAKQVGRRSAALGRIQR